MRAFHILFLLFLCVPLTELYILISVGQIVGVLPTIALVLFTAMLGAHLLRQQGLNTWGRFNGSLQQGQLPAIELVEGLLLLICGALLLTPGLLTDSVGFAMMVPLIRRGVAAFIIQRFKPNISVGGFGHASGPAPASPANTRSGNVIEGEYRRD